MNQTGDGERCTGRHLAQCDVTVAVPVVSHAHRPGSNLRLVTQLGHRQNEVPCARVPSLSALSSCLSPRPRSPARRRSLWSTATVTSTTRTRAASITFSATRITGRTFGTTAPGIRRSTTMGNSGRSTATTLLTGTITGCTSPTTCRHMWGITKMSLTVGTTIGWVQGSPCRQLGTCADLVDARVPHRQQRRLTDRQSHRPDRVCLWYPPRSECAAQVADRGAMPGIQECPAWRR